MNIYKENYKKLKILMLCALSNSQKYAKIKVSSYLPLSIECLEQTDDYMIISLAHYYEQNGDLMADPEMTIKVSDKECTAKAISYKQDCFGIYQRTEDSKKREFELNMFLRIWLNNLKMQGFYKESG